MTRTFFISLREAAKRLKKTQKELRSMARQERLQDYRDGSQVFFWASDVEALARRRDSSKQTKTRAPRRGRCLMEQLPQLSTGFEESE